MNSEPLSESIPRRRKGSAWRISSSAFWTRPSLLPEDRPRLHPRRVDVGHIERVGELPVGAIPAMRDQVELREPGAVTSQWSVFSGMWCLSSVPGLVRP